MTTATPVPPTSASAPSTTAPSTGLMSAALPTVLIVDDRPENLLALEAVLESLPINLVRADSGRAALRRLLTDEVAVIILDVQMPGIDGFETAQHIKARERTRHIPIIFLTALSTELQHALKGYETGAVDYVSKPFQPEVLRAKVSVLVELHQHARLIEEQKVLLAQRLEERDQAQAALSRQAAELERSNAELERFATLLSRDLSEPIHLAAGFLDLLGDRCAVALDSDGTLLLGKAQEAMARLFVGVDELMAYAKASTEAHAATEIDLEDVVDDVRRALHDRLGDADASLTSDPLPCINGDRWQLTLLFTHLVGNAIEHTGPGVEIHIGLSRREGSWVVSVHDDGPGISTDEMPQLFTLLGRPAVDTGSGSGGDGELTTRARGGQGVGLPIARRIVERHGGTIWADALAGKGTTISFTVPVASAVEGS